MKANKKTLLAVKSYLKNQEGWDLDEVVSEMVYDTKLLKSDAGENLISPDECTIAWGKDDICDLEYFISEFSDKFIESICNILDSFIGDDIDDYLDEEHE